MMPTGPFANSILRPLFYLSRSCGTDDEFAGKEGRALTFVDGEDRKLVKEIVKQTQAKLQERVILEATVKKWAAKIEGMASDIDKLVHVSPLGSLLLQEASLGISLAFRVF